MINLLQNHYEEPIDYWTYEGYQLDVPLYELTPKDKDLLFYAYTLVDNKWSIRQTAKNCLIPKSTLYDNLLRNLPKISFELYQCVRKVIYTHKS